MTTVSDRNFNGVADLAGPDLVSSNETRYVKLGSDWWRESRQFSYHRDNSAEPQLMSTVRTRLTGLGSIPAGAATFLSPQAARVTESVSVDLRGNATTRISVRDRDAATETAVTRYPTSTTPASSVSSNGLLVASTSQTGVTTTYGYDELERQISQTDGRGNTTRTVYDAQGRVSSTIDALGHATTYGYDALGRQTSVTDPLGHTVTTAYDAEGRVTSQRGATYPVDYAYDVYGNKVSMTTYRNESLTAGDTTRWLYDEPSGCMTNKVYADGKGPRYDYTPDGKLARRTWARGIATDYIYDNAGNLTRTEYNDNGVTPTITMSYDRVGNLINATTVGVVTNLYAYDLYGQCTNEWQNDFNLTRYYDALGRSIGYAINGTRQTTIAYDSVGRVSTMSVPAAEEGESLHSPTPTPNSNFFHWTYLPNSDLKASLQYPNGLTASWTYDANNQLLQVKNATPTNVISQFDYTYDAAGRRIQIAKSGTAFEFDDVVSYGYNARSELTNAVAAVDANYRYSYQYDPIGNRESSSERGTNTTYAANELNQYTQIAATGEDAFVPEFDDDGNQTLVKTATGIWQVTYNGENRPVLWTCLESNNHTISNQTILLMSYDRMGRRVTKNDQRFVYDGYLQICNYHATSTTLGYNYFILDPTELVATRPLVWNFLAVQPLNSSTSFYAHDGNKNVSEVLAVDGVTVTHYEYAPFGAVAETAQRITTTACDLRKCNPFRFSSEYADDALGLVYYNYRHDNPLNGRWCSRDLVSLDHGGEYAFLNNCFSSTDMLGLYDAHVHFYFIYGYLREFGWTHADALEAAYGSEYPDTGNWSATPGGLPNTAIKMISADSNEAYEWKLNNATFHNFNGLSAEGIRKYRDCIRTKIKELNSHKCSFGVGLLLHALGDTYAHVQVSGDAYDNGNRLGHLSDATKPDDVQDVVPILDSTKVDSKGFPLVTGWRQNGRIQFLGFIGDLNMLNTGTRTGSVAYSLQKLLADIYAPPSGWGKLFKDYKNDAADLLDNYGRQSRELDFLKQNIDTYIPLLKDKRCRDNETEKVREMLRNCLKSAGWKGFE